jgi:hypothetical protein
MEAEHELFERVKIMRITRIHDKPRALKKEKLGEMNA